MTHPSIIGAEQDVIEAAIELVATSSTIEPVAYEAHENELGRVVVRLLELRKQLEPAAMLAPVQHDIWVTRTWADVRADDTVRPPGSDATATVQTAARQMGHIDPRSSEYRPIPLEHQYIRVVFAGVDEPRRMMPDAPVEILMDEATAKALDIIPNGWRGRVGHGQDQQS